MPAAVDRTLAALADPHRRRIVEVLRSTPMRSSDIATAVRLSRPAASRHLGVLRRSGLVEERRHRKDSRVRVYRLRLRPFAKLQSWITELAAFWDEQLAAFKAHVEREVDAGPDEVPGGEVPGGAGESKKASPSRRSRSDA